MKRTHTEANPPQPNFFQAPD